MKIISAWVRHHPAISYYVLAFTVSWGGVALLGAPHGFPADSADFARAWPIVFIPFFLGPAISSIVLTRLVDGPDGIRRLLSRLAKWKVRARWYAISLLTAPLAASAILFALSLISPVYLPAIFTAKDKCSILLTGAMVGLIEGGLLEELGWTGFAVPTLRRRYTIFTTGIVAGALHALWHLFPTFWGSGNASGVFSPLLFLAPGVFYVGVLPAYRVLMVWVHDRTGSLLVTMLMHASLTGSTLFVLIPAATGAHLMTYYVLLTAVVWAVAALFVADRSRTANRAM